MPTTRTKTRNKPGAHSRRVTRVGAWSLIASLGLHAALVSAAVAVASLSADRFIPGPALPPAGLSAPVPVMDTPPDPQPAPPQPTPRAVSSPRAAPEPARADAAILAPAALVDARDLPADFGAPPAPLVQASEPAHTAPVRTAPTVFGVQGQREAQRIVYLVDASGSMVAALPAVLGEVARSIDALSPEQRFTVGVFSAGGVRTPSNLAPRGETLLAASESNKAAVRRWLQSIEARGGGDALDALRWGLTQRPDIVFLMAKGISDRGQTADQREATAQRFLDELERLNPEDARTGYRPVRINTIEFFDPDAAGLLERIGAAHGGAGASAPGSGHRFITRRELGLE